MWMPRGHTWLTRGSAWHATWQSDPLTRLLTGGQLPLTGDPAVVNGGPPPLTAVDRWSGGGSGDGAGDTWPSNHWLRGTVHRCSLSPGGTSTTAMSSMKAEYIAASEAAMEAIWICKFISGLSVVPNNDRPMDMYFDNTGAITIANEPGVQKDNNLVNPFTKPMSCTKHVEHARNIGLRRAGSFM
ncbi:hypothetical protein Tco_1245289 [Tanacetum coccineum]